MARCAVFVLALIALSVLPAHASAPQSWVNAAQRLKDVYEQVYGPPQHYMVEMRDGVSLSTVVYLGRGSNNDTRVPIVMDRSPYGHFATELLALLFVPFGFGAVMQDVRGARRSEGKYEFWRTDGEDAYDTMEWISQQPWSDGQVFQMGFSADGNAAFAGGRFQPEWLKGQWIGWATGSGYSTAYQGGAWVESLLEKWLTGTGFPEMIDEVLENEEWSSEFWDPIEIEANPGVCSWPSAHWAGWFDIFQAPSIEAWQFYQTEASGCPNRAQLFIDAHGHCGWMDAGDTVFPLSRLPLSIFQAIQMFVEESGNAEIKERFEALIRLPKDADALTFYVMGPGESSQYANYWTTMADFPTPRTENWYMQADGSLTSKASSTERASKTIVYDPENPVPTNGGNNLAMPCGQYDQRENEARGDVMVFTTAPFTEPYTVTGQMWATLFVESSANDTDFTVMVTDVYPDGRSMNLADGIVRMKWRDSNVVPSPIEQGVVYEVKVDLWWTSYVFEPGHSLRVDVSSSNAPRFNANRNNGYLVREQDNYPAIIATNTVHLSSTYPSRLELPIVELSDVPHNYFPGGSLPTFEEFIELAANNL